MTQLDNASVSLRAALIAVGLTWTAGTAVAVWANEMDNEIEALKREQTEEAEARKELTKSSGALKDAVVDLAHTIEMLQQRMELERRNGDENPTE